MSSLQFILGNSGSGKSHFLFETITREASQNPTKNYLVIVPEQFTLQTQKKLVEMSDFGAIMNVDVLSFKRLAYRVFDELGIADLNVLEETGKNLAFRKVALENENKLTVMRPNIGRIGYIDEVKSFISELMQYNITPDKLGEYIDKSGLPAVLNAKLKDVKVMYEGYEQFKKDKFISAEEILVILKNVACDSDILKGSVLVFDEFTGFTPLQNDLLRSLFSICDKAYFSLSIDAKEAYESSRGQHDLFDMTKATIKSLSRIANEAGWQVEDYIIMDKGQEHRFKDSKELYHLEQNLLRPGKIISYETSQPTEDIRLFSCKSPYDELMITARKINQIIRVEGLSYKDIAVVSGDVATYSNYVEEIFGKYHIPYFLDATKDALFHPFIEFMRALLDVIRRDFSAESVFRMLRCGYFDLEENQIDSLENFVLATGIRGRRRWKKIWTCPKKLQGKFDQEALEEMRLYIYELLSPLADVFARADATVKEEIMAIYELTLALDIQAKHKAKSEEYQQVGLQSKAKEYEQIYRKLMELLDKYVMLMGDEILDIKEFVEILDSGFDAASVAVVPPGFDAVTVGDIERTRLSDNKVLFFIGVNDGIIPASTNQGGIISQFERENLKAMDIELAPGARERTFIQRFYLYLNMTKPSRRLYVSYTSLAADGKSAKESYLINLLRKMFPTMKEERIEEPTKLLNSSTPEAAMDYMVFGERNEQWYALAKYFFKQEEVKEKLEKIIDAKFELFSTDPISRNIARALYGKNIEASVTRIEQYAKCAYAHYLRYGLKLYERMDNSFEDVDLGLIYHEALKLYGNRLKSEGNTWDGIDEAKRNELASLCIHDAVSGYSILSEDASAEYMHLVDRMEYVFKTTVWALSEQIRKGSFVPEEFEWSFKREVREDLSLKGTIDRIDMAHEEGKAYIKIIDYKTGSTKFNFAKLYLGQQLQLIVYLDEAIRIKEASGENTVTPAGVFYYHVTDPVIEISEDASEEDIKLRMLSALCPDGIINGDDKILDYFDENFEGQSLVIPVKRNNDMTPEKKAPVYSTDNFEIIRQYSQMKIKEFTEEMFNGNIAVNAIADDSYNSCKYCSYESLCHINSKLNGVQKRKCDIPKKSDILERMATELEIAKSRKEV